MDFYNNQAYNSNPTYSIKNTIAPSQLTTTSSSPVMGSSNNVTTTSILTRFSLSSPSTIYYGTLTVPSTITSSGTNNSYPMLGTCINILCNAPPINISFNTYVDVDGVAYYYSANYILQWSVASTITTTTDASNDVITTTTYAYTFNNVINLSGGGNSTQYVLLCDDSTQTYCTCSYGDNTNPYNTITSVSTSTTPNNTFYVPLSLYSSNVSTSSLLGKTIGYSIIFNG